jgi:hypothetical protein
MALWVVLFQARRGAAAAIMIAIHSAVVPKDAVIDRSGETSISMRPPAVPVKGPRVMEMGLKS